MFGTLLFWSYKKEFGYVITAFLLVLALPVVAVIILTKTGISIVSDALIGINPITRAIEIKNPVDGTVTAIITKPVVWPAEGIITLEFGESSRYQLFHTGIDIANPYGVIGDPVFAFMEGKVIFVGESFIGYGKHVIIDHGNNLTSVYAHLDRVLVYPQQEIDVGRNIGLEGNTGWATGPHLHFETRVYGIPVNPRIFLE